MNVRDTILTINSADPEYVRAINQHSREMGIELKGLSLIDKAYDREAPDRVKDTTGVYQEIICDFDNPYALQMALSPYMYRLLAVSTDYESAVQPLNKVLPFLPYIPKPSESSLLWSTEKPLMRDRMSTYDTKLTPKYQYMEASDVSNVDDLVKDFEFPVIVKPSDLAKALLVTECKDMKDLKKCLKHTFEVIDEVYSREHRRNTPSVLIEEFMQGDMYSTDAYVTTDGDIYCLPLVKVVTADSIGLPGFYSYRHIIPVSLSPSEVKAAFEAARSSVRALNLCATSTHIELIYTSNGWKIIELGARMGGYRQLLYKEAYGVEHYYNDLSVRMGNKPVMPGKPIKHAAGVNIYSDQEGIIESIEGINEASKLESVIFVRTRAKAGDEALFASNGGDLIVDGILSNTDADKLESDVARLRQLVKIKIKS